MDVFLKYYLTGALLDTVKMAKLKKTRTVYTFYNFFSGITGEIITTVLRFATRTVFVNTLGESYLGISGLFSNILSMLSLAELGIGNAILFKLYKPLAYQDQYRVNALLNFYKKVYFYIAVIVGMLGGALIPFLPVVIKDYDKLLHLNIKITFVFCLYLTESVSSYLFFAYKGAIIKAGQREYYINIVGSIFSLVTALLQMGCLIIYPSFELYIFISVLGVIVQNLVIAIIANKIFPYIHCKSPADLDAVEKLEIFKDCGVLFIYNLNNVIIRSTDNIVISIFLGVGIVGKYSNYLMLYTTIGVFYMRVINSVVHGFGELYSRTKDNYAHEYLIFKSIHLITSMIGGLAFVGVSICADIFITLWIGNDWTFEQPFSFLMGLEAYTLAYRHMLSKFRNAMGLFRQGKFRPIAGMVINLVLSVVLVNYIGVYGVMIGTIAADWTTIIWYDPVVIFRNGFHNFTLLKDYFYKFFCNIFLSVAAIIAIRKIMSYILSSNQILFFLIGISMSFFTIVLLYIVVYAKSEEGQYVYAVAMRQIKNIKEKIYKIWRI